MIDKTKDTPEPLSYQSAGVDIEAGARLVEAISPLAGATKRAGSLGGLGGFAALFDLKAEGWQDPILVSGTDGVGTKLILAFETGNHATIGIDLVAMCANDVLAQGGEPLFFLDYFATGKLDPAIAQTVISGIAEGCRLAGCTLVGGETAEMPGLYASGHYDLAGFMVGAVERALILPRQNQMTSGDALIGLSSSGPHSNGYSLIRAIVARCGLSWSDPPPFESQAGAQATLGDVLLTPTRIYVPAVLPLIKSAQILGLAHITGGGLTENTPRFCPPHLAQKIDRTAWTVPPVFAWLQATGNISDEEMFRTFNMGIGLVLALSKDQVQAVLTHLAQSGEEACIIGELGPA